MTQCDCKSLEILQTNSIDEHVLESNPEETPTQIESLGRCWVPANNHVADIKRDIFECKDTVGAGSTCMVVRASIRVNCAISCLSFKRSFSTTSVALKCIKEFKEDQEPSDDRAKRHFKREWTILCDLEHQHIVQLYGVFVDPTSLVIAQQLCSGGNLRVFIETYARMSEIETISITRQILNAISYLHLEHHIVHRGIQAKNIMFTDRNYKSIVVGDFGLSEKLPHEDLTNINFSCCGTPVYKSPELWESDHIRGDMLYACDMWAVGVTVYYMLTGRYPFMGNDVTKLSRVIRLERFRDLQSSPSVLMFLACCLDKNWQTRLTVADAIRYDWGSRRGEQDRQTSATKPVDSDISGFDDFCFDLRDVSSDVHTW